MPKIIKVTDQSNNGKVEVRKVCTHPNIVVERPCCTSPDSDGNWSCGCGGHFSVYCPDCDNTQLTDDETSRFIRDYRG